MLADRSSSPRTAMTSEWTTESNEPDCNVEEGLRLVKALQRIKDPLNRKRLLEFAEQFASTDANKITSPPPAVP